MQIGIFAKTFPRPTIEANLDAVAAHGFYITHYNFACAGLATLPDSIPARVVEQISQAAADRGITIAAISATFNIIDPNSQLRQTNLRRLAVVAKAAHNLGANLLTLCSGTCDPHDMWRHHPDNSTTVAWREMVQSIRAIVSIAESAGVMVAIEPEQGNVVNTAQSARHLLDEIGSCRLKIVLDAANLVDSADPHRMRDVLDEAVELLGSEIVIAHAKDVRWEDGPQHRPAGRGMLDYQHYLAGLRRCGFTGPLILHGLAEEDVAGCREFLLDQLARLEAPTRRPLPMARAN
jgi:sugar phosphate isomerase/epimerase